MRACLASSSTQNHQWGMWCSLTSSSPSTYGNLERFVGEREISSLFAQNQSREEVPALALAIWHIMCFL